MTELEKCNAGVECCYVDEELRRMKCHVIRWCEEHDAIDGTDFEAQYAHL